MDFEYLINNKIHAAATDYVLKNHSDADNDFQNAMRIAVVKAFVAGAKYIVDNINIIKEIKNENNRTECK